MTTMPLRVTGGVETHLDVHVAAVLDHLGGLLILLTIDDGLIAHVHALAGPSPRAAVTAILGLSWHHRPGG
jgi:hypothetical protein